jgi:hypothetical protein
VPFRKPLTPSPLPQTTEAITPREEVQPGRKPFPPTVAGPALYLLAYVALRLRVSRTLGRGRLIAAVACALLFPTAVVVPALVALALVAAVWVAFDAYEIIWWREARARTRALHLPASVF